MRRNALPVLAFVLTFVLLGCARPDVRTQTDLQSAAPGGVDMSAPLPAEQPASRLDGYDYSLPSEHSEPALVAEKYLTGATAQRYHVVAKKETLYALARMYYNDARRWKDIFEANRATIDDPDRILIGQRLLIP